ncbi:preprotein translocase subunit SecE [Gynurincola endophyticus]|jgi:preprotein translocase subunit SecE|uniref:preprotein translocase subunit SecE n=1 Tax=Gynurincola endophyticus TaxID=2479004 RepID=UPI000F8D5470|nr:preprotein translocase subunit SecE [Gynurincola endophyticus]
MSKVANYFKNSWQELTEKVTWPNWNQLQQSTVIVLIGTIIITLLVWVLDLISQTVLNFIYSI